MWDRSLSTRKKIILPALLNAFYFALFSSLSLSLFVSLSTERLERERKRERKREREREMSAIPTLSLSLSLLSRSMCVFFCRHGRTPVLVKKGEKRTEEEIFRFFLKRRGKKEK
jgi:hypothetical protein